MIKIKTWQDYDDERLRRLSAIVSMEFKLNRAKERLDDWAAETVASLKATVGERKRK